MSDRKTVVFGFLGSALDGGRTDKRWGRWRPTVAMCRQPDLRVDRIELLVDNHAASIMDAVLGDIAQVSPHTEVRVHRCEFTDSWDFEEMYGALWDLAADYPFDTEAEDYLVNITTGTHVGQMCLFFLAETKNIPGRILQLSPPPNRREDGVEGIGTFRIVDLDLSRYDAITSRFSAEKVEATSFLKSGIATRNAAFNTMIDEIEKVGIRSRAPVLLTGPTGAGKSLLARRIYELKRERHQVTGAFVEVNCATLRGDQAMSTLFGHTSGAFTGAMRPRTGLLREANKGVLFLDEIGELGADEQAMMLRAIEDKRFLPVGSDKEVVSDFQLIAGTNCDLAAEVRSGRFRDDLLARLNQWSFRLPSLAERREDIEPNLDFELERYSRVEGRRATFNREARELYLAFAVSPEAKWRANFRDLSSSIARMATLAPNCRIDVATAEAEIARLRMQWRDTEVDEGEILLIELLGEFGVAELDLFDRVQLGAVLRACRASASLSEAGRTLFAASRRHKVVSNDADRLRKYLYRFGLTFDRVRATH